MPGLPVLPVVLIALVLLNGLALLRPRGGALAQAVGTGLLLPLLLVASLPMPPQVRGPLLLSAATAITLLLGWALLAPLGALWAAEGNGASRKAAGIATRPGVGFVITALALSLGTALLFALRPNPYEYPGDTVDYLNTFQRLTQAGHPPASCLNDTWRMVTYWRACTLWTTLLEASPMDTTTLLSGLPQRTTILGEHRTQITTGAVAIIGQRFGNNGNAMRAIAFIADFFVILALTSGDSALDGAVNRVARHIRGQRGFHSST